MMEGFITGVVIGFLIFISIILFDLSLDEDNVLKAIPYLIGTALCIILIVFLILSVVNTETSTVQTLYRMECITDDKIVYDEYFQELNISTIDGYDKCIIEVLYDND